MQNETGKVFDGEGRGLFFFLVVLYYFCFQFLQVLIILHAIENVHSSGSLIRESNFLQASLNLYSISFFFYTQRGPNLDCTKGEFVFGSPPN